MWKTTRAALEAAAGADSGLPEPVVVKPWDPATHALCSGIMEDIVEKALQRLDHRPEAKLVERCDATVVPTFTQCLRNTTRKADACE